MFLNPPFKKHVLYALHIFTNFNVATLIFATWMIYEGNVSGNYIFDELPSNAHISTPFFRKTVFFSKIFLGKPPSKFLEVCPNSEYIWKWSPVYNFSSARALKKLISAGVEVVYLHFANLRHTEGFTNVNAFIQLCPTSTLFCYLNKTDANPNMTFEHLNTIFHHVRAKA